MLIECNNRCVNLGEDIKEVIDILNIKITNEKNLDIYYKYCNGLRFYIKFIHRQLQNIDFKCKSPIDNLLYELLVGKIYIEKTYEMNYSYPLSKIMELHQESGDKIYAKTMHKELLLFFNNYIEVTEEDLQRLSNEELYVLSQVAIYLHELDNDGTINKYIPAGEVYR